MDMRFAIHLIGLFVAGLPALAGEDVVLTNGFRLHADRHEADGAFVRIYDSGGVRQLPAAAIDRFEAGYDSGHEAVEQQNAALPAVNEAVLVTGTAVSPAPATPQEIAGAAAQKFELPEGFVMSVMRTESGFNPAALSPKRGDGPDATDAGHGAAVGSGSA